jgi:hypothetical protein
MTRTASRGHSRALLVSAVAAVLVGGMVVPAAFRSSDGSMAMPSSEEPPLARSAPDIRPVVPARRAASAVQPEAPTSARLPSGTTVPIAAVSTGADGSLAVPQDIWRAGWWRGGSRIGDPFGSTLVAAHIDSTSQGLGPYAELLGLGPGERIRLASAALEQTFEVASLRLIPQGSLGHEDWLFSASGQRRLTLVTCAPPYDAARGGYQRLAVVTALPVTTPTTRQGR